MVINPETQTVTLQKKALGRAGFDRPNYADFTVGGDYHVGETIPDGIREAHEELGLHALGYLDFFPSASGRLPSPSPPTVSSIAALLG